MSFRRRFFSALVAIFAFTGAATQMASCALEPYGTETPEQDTPCATDANCDDKNPCTIDACQADGTCARPNGPNGPLMQQIAGDCRRDDCMDGQVVSTNDDADIADDNEPCTTDSCGNGDPVHMPLGDNTMCTMGASPGKCLMGVCTVECSPTKPCDDKNPCTEDSCNAGLGTCTFIPLDGLPTPGFQEPVGDCKLHICDNGADAPINDDADVPDDNNSCTLNVCTAGMGSNPGASPGTPCVVGQPEVCDGSGACVACNDPADCILLPPDDDCQQRTCTNHMCGQTFTTMGTPTTSNPPQTPGDCKRIVCDGNGKTTVEVFNTDLPVDNNSCTQNLCTNGTPSNPLEVKDFVCGANQVCDDKGNCVGCNDASQCVGTDDFCKTRTCINQICGYSYKPTGTDLPTGQTSQDCKVVECDGMGNTVTSVDLADKPVDGNQCTQDVCSAQGAPSNPNEPVNTACNQTGGTVCNGAGACKKANGDPCAAAGDCLSSFCVDGVCCNAACSVSCKSCNVPGSVGSCVNVPKANEDAPGCTGINSCDGSGTCKKDDGQGCSMGSDCVSNFCVDGVCCASACTTACRSCNIMGSVGICSNITSGDDNFPANVCNGTKSCDSSGACKTKDGQTCATGSDCVSGQCFDGVCCNVACSGTCKSCNITGAVGICSNIAAGQDDANGVPSCSGANQSCDGNGICKKEIAQGCAANAECLSGFCVDGVCCNNGCTATCQACNLTNNVGTCTNVTNGQDDVGTCSGTNLSCDGMGACKSELGIACSNAASCLSGFCVDGYCCNTACVGSCQACSALVAGQGTNGTCGPIITATDPDNECTNGSCNGASTCKLDQGFTCSMNSQCLSGFCADGVCCNSACGNSDTTDCQACSVATGAMMNGTCSPLAAATTCRASAGICDVAETCNGSSTACPANGFATAGTSCRGVAGTCDVAETCTGSSATCPADVFVASGTTCRASAGGCDVVETCSGMSAACPNDGFSAMGTVCRASAGGCDVVETCSGSSAACPNDGFSAMGTVCRASAGGCDVAESCSGSSAACPNDGFSPMGTVCRVANGGCDVAESCNGSSGACPADGFSAMGTVCRVANGGCDVAESCSGSSGACPADGFSPMGTVCRIANGGCDVAETCSGSAGACPADGFSPMGTVCRIANGACDNAETCSGSSGACPTDGFKASGTVCRMAVDVCDNAETCSGASAACPNDTLEPNTFVCRPAIGDCDVEEKCTGAATSCPTDVYAPDTTTCRTSAGMCDIAEMCTGISDTCPTDAFEPSSTVCRNAVGACDVAESCTGSAAACPTNGFAASGTVCAAQTCSNGTQTNEDTCNATGMCIDGGTMSCGNYVCNVDTDGCYTMCSTNGECAAGHTCNGTMCQ